MEAARRRARQRIRIIKVQWLVILALIVALIISIATQPAVSSKHPVLDIPQTLSPPTQATASAPELPKEPELIPLGEFRTTAYCTCVKCCGVWSQDHPSRLGTNYVQKTASSTIPTAGRTIAVDTEVIPFGTVVVIDGHEYVAEDVGSAVNGNVIDIYFDSHESACEYGVQYKTIYIKGE